MSTARRRQIMAMSTMKDKERLELLKEIGGTKVYEDRRRESLKILHDTDNRGQQINEVVRASHCCTFLQAVMITSAGPPLLCYFVAAANDIR